MSERKAYQGHFYDGDAASHNYGNWKAAEEDVKRLRQEVATEREAKEVNGIVANNFQAENVKLRDTLKRVDDLIAASKYLCAEIHNRALPETIQRAVGFLEQAIERAESSTRQDYSDSSGTGGAS